MNGDVTNPCQIILQNFFFLKKQECKIKFYQISHKGIFNFKQHLSSQILQGVRSCTVQMLFFSRKGNEKTENQSNHLLITCDVMTHSRIALILPFLCNAINEAA